MHLVNEVLTIAKYCVNFGAAHLLKISLNDFIVFKIPGLRYIQGESLFNVFPISALGMTGSPCLSQ